MVADRIFLREAIPAADGALAATAAVPGPRTCVSPARRHWRRIRSTGATGLRPRRYARRSRRRYPASLFRRPFILGLRRSCRASSARRPQPFAESKVACGNRDRPLRPSRRRPPTASAWASGRTSTVVTVWPRRRRHGRALGVTALGPRTSGQLTAARQRARHTMANARNGGSIISGSATERCELRRQPEHVRAMRAGLLVSKCRGPDWRRWLTTRDASLAGDRGSPRALGFGDRSPCRAPGYQADIVMLDLDSRTGCRSTTRSTSWSTPRTAPQSPAS